MAIFRGLGWRISSTEQRLVDKMPVGNVAAFKLLEQSAIIVRNVPHFQFVIPGITFQNDETGDRFGMAAQRTGIHVPGPPDQV